MEFLIDTRDGKTITATLAGCSQPYEYVDRIDYYTDEADFVCVLSTARSMEAVKEATGIMRRILDGSYLCDDELEAVSQTWLEKWGRD